MADTEKGGNSAQDEAVLPIVPLGLVEGTSMISSAAAPLLAGFALTILLLVLPNTTAGDETTTFTRWPEAVICLLTIAAVLLVNTVQAGAHARSHHVSTAVVTEWFGDKLMKPDAVANHVRQEIGEARRWVDITRRLYQAGILMLLLAIALLLVPPEDQPVNGWRVLSLSVAGAAALLESLWVSRNALEIWKKRRGSSSAA
jgi:hypothetical protein